MSLASKPPNSFGHPSRSVFLRHSCLSLFLSYDRRNLPSSSSKPVEAVALIKWICVYITKKKGPLSSRLTPLRDRGQLINEFTFASYVVQMHADTAAHPARSAPPACSHPRPPCACASSVPSNAFCCADLPRHIISQADMAGHAAGFANILNPPSSCSASRRRSAAARCSRS